MPFRERFKNNCQAANLFHTFSAVTQGITLHLKLLSLYLRQKRKVNLNPFNLLTFQLCLR